MMRNKDNEEERYQCVFDWPSGRSSFRPSSRPSSWPTCFPSLRRTKCGCERRTKGRIEREFRIPIVVFPAKEVVVV